jgi:hypothetical protein
MSGCDFGLISVRWNLLCVSAISRDVVHIIAGMSGRFLQLDKATEDWEEVSDAVAREKFGSRFRQKAKDSESSP